MFVRTGSRSLVIVVLLLLPDVHTRGLGAAAGELEPLKKNLEAGPDSSSSYFLPFDSGRKFSVQKKKGFRARIIPTSGIGTGSTRNSNSAAPLSHSHVFSVASSLILLVALFFV